MRYSDLHNDLCRPTSSKIPIESRLQLTNDVSSTDSDMSYGTNIMSSTNTGSRKRIDQFDAAGIFAQTQQVAKVISPLITDRKTSVVTEGGCDTEASTCPFLATVAKCSKNQRNKVRYKCVQRRKPRQNCQPTKKLPRKRRKEELKYRQYDSMIQQIYDRIEAVSSSCQSSAKECRQALERIQRLLHQNWIEKFWQQWILQQIGIQISQSEDNAAVLLSHASRPNSKVPKTTSTQGAYSRMPGPGSVKSTKLSTESARSQSSSLASAPGLANGYKKPQGQLFSFIQSENVKESTSKKVSAKIKSTSARSSKFSSFQNLSTTNSSFSLHASTTGSSHGANETDG